MQLLNSKDFDELTTESLEELRNIGFSTQPGSIAKLFLNIVNKNIAGLYTTLTTNHLRAFLSTSSGDAIDAIGALFHCDRFNNETDENYKYRISNQCLSLATANRTAIYLACLAVDGVTDVVLTPYSMGTGTFSVVIITDKTDSLTVIEDVKAKISEVCGYGIRYEITTPTLVPIKLKYQLVMNNSISDTDKQELRYKVQANLIDYIGNLKIGETLYVEKLGAVILNSSNDILSFTNLSIKINAKTALYVNQTCRWMEQFILSSEKDNIVIL